jgi:mycothiol synthase
MVAENRLAMRARVREAGRMDKVGRLRAATPDDADAVLELNLLSDLAEIGEPNTTIDEVNHDLATDGLAGAVVEDLDGGLIGYAWHEHQSGHQKSWGDLIIRPGVDGPVGDVLLGWLRRTAREVAPGLPMHVFADSGNAQKKRLYEAAGGKIIRRFFRMGITFDDASPTVIPDPSPGVAIRAIADDEADLRAMHSVVDVAFLDHFGHEAESYEQWVAHARGCCPDLSLWWLATVAGEPAAGLYASLLPDAGYVDTLGTLRAFRGRGLGRLLLLTSFAEFRRRGLPKAVLGVDATNPTGALGLYESAGMTAEHQGLRYELTP